MRRIVLLLVFAFVAGGGARGAADDSPNAVAVRELVKKTGEGSNAEGGDEVLDVRLGKDTTDAHLKALADLAPPSLWKINLATTDSLDAKGKQQTKFTRSGFKELTRLPALRELQVHKSCCDDDLKEIAGSRSLEKLLLIFSQVTDAGLAHLAAAPKLREIDLRRSRTTDACWEPLSKVATLEKITACERVKGQGVGKLAGLKKLGELNLEYSAVTDAALAEVAKLATVRTLKLSNTKITDDGLKELAGLTDVRDIRLSDTKVTPAGVAALKKALPKCQVTQ